MYSRTIPLEHIEYMWFSLKGATGFYVNLKSGEKKTLVKEPRFLAPVMDRISLQARRDPPDTLFMAYPEAR